jgi:hypothetical protein
MKLKYILYFTIYFTSCEPHGSKVKTFKADDFFLVDTTEIATRFLQFGDKTNDYPIYYIGPILDTIQIGKQYWRGRTKWRNDFSTPQSRSYAYKSLHILVYPSIRLNAPVEYLSESLTAVKDSTVNYHSFLFSIQNISDSSIYVGRTFSVFFIHREAKDLKGNWVTIDKKLSELSLCGTGEPAIMLKPREILISKVKRYKGNFYTDFRLAFGYDKTIVYSNVFKDSIDLRTIEMCSPTEE